MNHSSKMNINKKLVSIIFLIILNQTVYAQQPEFINFVSNEKTNFQIQKNSEKFVINPLDKRIMYGANFLISSNIYNVKPEIIQYFVYIDECSNKSIILYNYIKEKEFLHYKGTALFGNPAGAGTKICNIAVLKYKQGNMHLENEF